MTTEINKDGTEIEWHNDAFKYPSPHCGCGYCSNKFFKEKIILREKKQKEKYFDKNGKLIKEGQKIKSDSFPNDILITKFSKAGGAFLLQGLLVALGSIAAIMPFVAIILFFILVFWIISVFLLNKHFIIASKKIEKIYKKPKLIKSKAAEKISKMQD